MTHWWQDITTGEVFERPDLATCRREALERMLSQPTHYVYVSRTRILAEHGQWWRDAGCPDAISIRSKLTPDPWDADTEKPQAEAWGCDPEPEVWAA
jgi:hypothetical protein